MIVLAASEGLVCPAEAAESPSELAVAERFVLTPVGFAPALRVIAMVLSAEIAFVTKAAEPGTVAVSRGCPGTAASRWTIAALPVASDAWFIESNALRPFAAKLKTCAPPR